MGSSRLPGKVLMEICGKPIIAHLCERIQSSQLLTEIVIATTTEIADDAIAEFCSGNNIHCFRGSQYDVLDRYYRAAMIYDADVIVRLTADCPLLDGELVDSVVQAFLDQKVDFAANRLPPPWKRTFPIGLDIEIASFAALEEAWNKADQVFEREHVMPYLYNQPGRFKTLLLQNERDYGTRRWTVDTPQDLELMDTIFTHFKPRTDFSWKEVLFFLDNNPEIEQLNKNIQHKSMQETDERNQSAQADVV